MENNLEFKKFNDLQISITSFSVNTPADLEELFLLLKKRNFEIKRLAKLFGLEDKLKGINI